MLISPKGAWFQDVPRLRERVGKFYDKAMELGKSDCHTTTARKIIDLRGWVLSNKHRASLLDVCRELDVFYVPQAFLPGPCYVFPCLDVDGGVRRAQTKPLHQTYVTSKYMPLGPHPLGPQWFGLSDLVFSRLMTTKSAVLVEGPFDLVAARTVCPEANVLTVLTKGMSDTHAEFLELIGVERIYPMFDNEKNERGDESARYIERTYGDRFDIQLLKCPAHDPSDALKNHTRTRMLRDILSSTVKIGTKPTEISIEEDALF